MKKFLKKCALVVAAVPVLIFASNFYQSEKYLRSSVEFLIKESLSSSSYQRALLSRICPDESERKTLLAEIDNDYRMRIRESALQGILGTSKRSPARIFTMNWDGKKKKYLKFKGEYSYGRWSPDMSKILFHGIEKVKNKKKDKNKREEKDSRANQIYIYDILLDEFIQLTENGSNKEADWGPFGEEIIFCSDRNQTSKRQRKYYDLYTMNSDGSNIKLFLKCNEINRSDTDLSICLPTFSPDRTFIGFSTNYQIEDVQSGWDLWAVARENKENRIRISNWGNCRMRWNPQNIDEIVFVQDRRNEMPDDVSDPRLNKYKDFGDIIIAELKIDELENIVFKKKRNLTKEHFPNSYPFCATDNFPEWFSNGTEIIFSSCENATVQCMLGKNWLLFTTDRDSKVRELFAGKKIRAFYPDW